jgi:prepilin-type N-terminal cleavage/methylation domain-containing protein
MRSACSSFAVLARSRRRGFTLLELMAVVAIMAFTALGFALALSDTGGNALATGQTLLSTMVGTARTQAAVNQTEARLLIYGTRPPAGSADKFLRLMQVVRAEPAGSNTWVAASAVVELPRGIFVVPTAVNGLLAAGVVWPANPPLLSTLGAPFNPAQVAGTPFASPATAFFIEFRADGTCTQAQSAYARLLVATATLSAANLPQFNNAAAVRGLLIRPSGSVTFVNDAANF